MKFSSVIILKENFGLIVYFKKYIDVAKFHLSSTIKYYFGIYIQYLTSKISTTLKNLISQKSQAGKQLSNEKFCADDCVSF